MMGNWRKRIGRFGAVQRVAATAAIAILAVSPALVPAVGSHLDGIGRAAAEAVFGEPVYAQEPCQEISSCLEAVEEEYEQCRERNPWYKDFLCYAARQLSRIACALSAVVD